MSKFNWDAQPDATVASNQAVVAKSAGGSKKFSWDDQPDATTEDSSSPIAKAGKFLMDKVVEPIGTAVDYTYAPIRQAMAAPAKIARGNISGAILDPFTQLGKNPKTAPTSAEVAEMYGIPKEKDVQGMAVANPLFATTYEMNPDKEDKDNVKVFPSAQAGALMDASIGGEGINAIAGGLSKIGGVAGKGIGALAETIGKPQVRLNATEIREAAGRLGIKVTPGMLDNSGFVERLESTLAESPSFLGQSVARNRNNVVSKLNDAAAGLTSDATNLSPFQLGEKFKSGMTAEVGQKFDPISAVFDDVAKSTKSIPVSDRSKSAIINNISNLDTYKLTGGAGKPQQYVDMIGRIENADNVKTVMTMLNSDIGAAEGAEKQVLIGIRSKLGTLEDNSITRAAIQQARDGGMRTATGKQIGSDIVNDLRDARSNWRSNSEDLQSLAKDARIKTDRGPEAFLNSVEDVPSEKIQDKFFNLENNRALTNLQEKFPEQFDLLRQGKLKDIAAAAVDNSKAGRGSVSSDKFLKEVNSLNPEAKQMLFKDNASTLNDLQTVQQSVPRNFNPSGTATTHGWQDAAVRNLKDIPSYLLYRGASSKLGQSFSEAAAAMKAPSDVTGTANLIKQAGTASVTPGLATRQLMLDQAAQSAKAAAEGSKPEPGGGPEKWANEGADKILKHDPTLDPDLIERVKQSKKGRELLAMASDLKPGSKAMDKILGELNRGDY
jgi:hypothetical protein